MLEIPRYFLGAKWEADNKNGKTYRQIAEYNNVSRNVVAAAIRDYRSSRQGKKLMNRDRQPSAPVFLRACVFDIETTNFAAETESDILVCTSFIPLDGEKPYTVKISHDDIVTDQRDLNVLAETMSELEKYDILIGHNIAAYDLNWLLTRLMFYNLPTPTMRHLYYDTYSAAKRVALKTWKNLGSLCAFFGLEGDKTKIFRPDWMEVLSPNKDRHQKAVREIVYHCEEDVLMNRQVFFELWKRDNKLNNLPVWRKW